MKIEHEGGRLRDEYLNETLFTSMAQARAVLPAWWQDFNTVRPNSKLGGLTPPRSPVNGDGGMPPSPLP